LNLQVQVWLRDGWEGTEVEVCRKIIAGRFYALLLEKLIAV
jgi:hypothetical protein